MRISDWSSDVCSSDLRQHHRLGQRAARRAAGAARCRRRPGQRGKAMRAMTAEHRTPLIDRLPAVRGRLTENAPLAGRSEEHTSELQSLMRISYAVFCLKKKNTKKNKV